MTDFDPRTAHRSRRDIASWMRDRGRDLRSGAIPDVVDIIDRRDVREQFAAALASHLDDAERATLERALGVMRIREDIPRPTNVDVCSACGATDPHIALAYSCPICKADPATDEAAVFDSQADYEVHWHAEHEPADRKPLPECAGQLPLA